MIERNSGIRIWEYDLRGPETKDEVASFEIKDPRLPATTRNSFCIGFKLIRPRNEITEPGSWQYDHTNYYDCGLGAFGDGESEPISVSREQIEEILERFSSTLEGLLVQYCELLKETE